MPIEAILLLITIAVLANLALMAAVLSPSLRRRLRIGPSGDIDGLADADSSGPRLIAPTFGSRSPATPTAPTAPTIPPRDPEGAALSAAAFDRVVRVVAWVFLLATSVVVAVTGLWREQQPGILVLVALAGLFVLVVHDVLPADALGPAKFVIEGSVAITFAALLVLMTGQASSPFFFTFPLIVGGAALVVSSRATVVLTAVASLAYLAAISVGRPDPLPKETIATVGVNLTALILLAYVGMVLAKEQRRARDEAVRLATIDPLTGLFNRAYFFGALDREIIRSQRTGRRFCLLMMDLDELKVINDRLGHFHGDRALRAVGDVIRDGTRRIDTAARYGGDEFVVLLPETDPTGAWVLAEKIRLGAGEIALEASGTPVRTSLSVGVVCHPDDGTTADMLMIRADEAMYASKRAGKDRVMGVPTGTEGRTGRAV
ncbi:MAG: GGDEF domain-containing protein [Chloroflexota bacterium]